MAIYTVNTHQKFYNVVLRKLYKHVKLFSNKFLLNPGKCKMSYGTYTVIDRYRSQEQTVKLAKAGCLATLSNVRFKHPWLCDPRYIIDNSKYAC